jgi:hypothetical protein
VTSSGRRHALGPHYRATKTKAEQAEQAEKAEKAEKDE